MASPRVSKAARKAVEAAAAGRLAESREAMISILEDAYAQLSEKNPMLRRTGYLWDNGKALVDEADPVVAWWPIDDEGVCPQLWALKAIAWIRAALETVNTPKARIADLTRFKKVLTDLRAEHLAAAGEEPEEDTAEVRAQAWRQLLEGATVDELEQAVEDCEARLRALLATTPPARHGEEPTEAGALSGSASTTPHEAAKPADLDPAQPPTGPAPPGIEPSRPQRVGEPTC